MKVKGSENAQKEVGKRARFQKLKEVLKSNELVDFGSLARAIKIQKNKIKSL